MTIPLEHRLMVVQSLLKETERDAALIAAELVLDLVRMPGVRSALAEELEREAESSSGPRSKIMHGIAERLREVSGDDAGDSGGAGSLTGRLPERTGN